MAAKPGALQSPAPQPATKLAAQCIEGASCVIHNGKGKTHCNSEVSPGVCKVERCANGFSANRMTNTCTPVPSKPVDDCRSWGTTEKPCVYNQKDEGRLVCDQDSGRSKCVPKIATVAKHTAEDGGGYWGVIGMLLIGGVIGAMFYLKSHLPPQVQAYLGGVTTKTVAGAEYEMVPMQAKDDIRPEGLGSSGGLSSGTAAPKPKRPPATLDRKSVV